MSLPVCLGLAIAQVFGNRGKDLDSRIRADLTWNLNLFSLCLRPPLVGMEVMQKKRIIMFRRTVVNGGHAIGSDSRNSSLDTRKL